MKVAQCLCPIFAAYAKECTHKEVMIDWRNGIRECGKLLELKSGFNLLVVIFLFAYIFTFCMLIVKSWYENFCKHFSVASNIYSKTLILHFCEDHLK